MRLSDPVTMSRANIATVEMLLFIIILLSRVLSKYLQSSFNIRLLIIVS